ncbi:T9SS type A sorting domain-containing protein, partial [Lutimonas halocynthiae]|uniref:T9SS type A sorting domain-containing protein n=1 Tax=Lutimonas halocynthiae TaxID=1446477 RepID=UPI0025B3916F
ENVKLTASGADGYSWSTGDSTSEITVNPDKTTTYTVSVTDGITTDEAKVTVTVNEVNADAGKDVTITEGEEVTLTASGGDSYLWTNGETTESITVSPSESTVFEVTVSSNGCEDTDQVKVNVKPNIPPVVPGISENLSICKGENVKLTASGADGYSWSTGDSTSEITVNPDKTTTYTVSVTDGITTDEAKVTVTVNEVIANAGKDVTIAEGEEVILTASGGDTYLWNTGETSSSITVSPKESKTYSVTVSSNGCEDTDQVSVRVETNDPEIIPVIAELSKDISICSGESAVLTANGGSTYSWNTGASTSEITVSPTKTTIYTVSVTDGITTDEAEVTVTVNEVNANAGKDVTITEGEEVILTASGGDTYLWTTGETTSSITVSPKESETYDVTVSSNGCEDTDQVSVRVKTNDPEIIPVIAELSKDMSICSGESAVLTANGGSTYSWNTGASTSEITVSPTKTTTYTVSVTDGITTDEAEVTITVNEVNAYAGKDVTIREGEEVILTASGGDTYLWNTGETTSSITVSPKESETYDVTVSSNGCEDTDQVSVRVETNDPEIIPVIAELSKDISICSGESAVLTANGGSTYSWNTGASTSEITVSPTKTTTYTVSVTDGITTDEAKVTVTVNEVNADAGKDVTIREGESTKLTANGGNSYQWSTGENAKSIIVTPHQTTEYEVEVKKNGCISFDTVRVNVIPLENSSFTVSAGNDISICPGENVSLSASGGSIFKWNTGASSKSINVSPKTTTTYAVEVSDGKNKATAEVTVEIHNVDATIGENRTIDRGDPVTLTAGGGEQYEWSNGSTSKSITISPLETKIYSVTVFKNGCQDTANVQVTVNKENDNLDFTPPVADAGSDVTICLGESTVLEVKGAGSFLWSTGDKTTSVKVSPKRTTTYEVQAQNGDVTVTDTIVVYVESCPETNDEVADLKLVVYPNPSNGLVTIDIKGAEKSLELELFDMNGRLIHKEKIDARYQQINKEVDLSRLPKGMYLLRLYNIEQNVVSKILLV